MPQSSFIDQAAFRRVLARNLSFPLALGAGSAILFVGLVVYLLSVLNWVENTERVIGNANQATKLMVDMQSAVRGYLITGDESSLAPYDLAKPRVLGEIAALREMVRENPVQVDRLNQIELMHQEWSRFAETVTTLKRKKEDFQQEVRNGRAARVFDQIRIVMDNFLEVEQRLRQARHADARKVSINIVIVFVVLILSLTGLLAFLGRRQLMRLSESYNFSIVEQHRHSEVLEVLAWQRAGQGQLAEQYIGQMSLADIGETVLDFLASYVDAKVAALYVCRSDKQLQRMASHGFSQESMAASQSFDFTDSQVGLCASSKRMVELDEVPDSYVTVSSGLGTIPARHIVLVPIMHERSINGVIELGFLKKPVPRVLEFLLLVAPSIGNAIEAALHRTRLNDILAEAQQLNEELQVQQEELRTTNEELEEQSSMLQASETFLQKQQAELERSNLKLTEQTESLDQKNTELNAIRVELEQRALALQRASKYKSEFLANMSHELRTPLNSSLILAKLLAENSTGNLTDEQIRFADTIYAAGNDLLNLINDILDISKVEAGKLELNNEDVLLQHVAIALRTLFSPMAAQKKLRFNVVVWPDTPSTLFSDRQRIDQILKNLLSNAIKFTENGRVTLRIEPGDNGMIAFVVQDSGIGVASDQHDTIFEAFQQADGTTSRRYGGTGLGLSISRDLATLLGGTISVSSVAGEGSAFTLLLPLRPLQEVENTLAENPNLPANTHANVALAPLNAVQSSSNTVPAPAPPFAAAPVTGIVLPALFKDDREDELNRLRTVLVIEDELSFARIMYDLAHERNYRCLVAHGAIDGLQVAKEFLPDAILLDLALPDGSGMGVLQKLKTDSLTRHIPVHIISGSDRVVAAMQLGAIGYDMKPTTRQRLKEVFEKIERRFAQTVKRVLLVEDDERQRDSVVQLISDDDVDITAVAFGEEALQHLRTTVFDCMIIDLKLADLQGYELLQRMATESICSFPPVIVYTGRSLTREEEQQLQKYSRSIIIKGARSPERLLDEVTLFLHKVESQLTVERQSMLRTVRSRDHIFDGRRILLVDDDVRNIFSLSSALEMKGMLVEIGRNGMEALEKLETNPGIDLVLMDVMMPVMDGLEATRRIRTDPRFKALPIIAITAKAMKDDQEQCISAGSSDYLAKPIDLDRLYSLLRVWLPSTERAS